MASQVILKKSNVINRAPAPEDLVYGELALNYTDGKLYFLKSDGTTISYFPSSELIGSGGGSTSSATIAKTFMMMGA